MPTWIIPAINLLGPLLVKLAEDLFMRGPKEPKTGPEKKQYVLSWLISTWDLLVYLNVLPDKLSKKRDLILKIFSSMIEEWVLKLKEEKKLPI